MRTALSTRHLISHPVVHGRSRLTRTSSHGSLLSNFRGMQAPLEVEKTTPTAPVELSPDALPCAGERICSRDGRAVGGGRLQLNEQFIVDNAHVSYIGFTHIVWRN